MDDQRVGSIVRALRRRRRWRQADLAELAHLSPATISRFERGHIGSLSLRAMRSVAAPLDLRLDLTPRWRGGELDRLLNARHAALTGAVAAQLAAASWEVAPEASFSIYGERGAIDLLAWHSASRSLLVVEAKTAIVDIGDLIGSVDRKRRLAPRIAAERGWGGASTTSVWVVVSDGRTNRRRVATHRDLLRAAFPVDGRTIGSWLAAPATPLNGLSFLPDVHRWNARTDLRGTKRVTWRPRRVS